jgi:hypothetical protein
MLLLGSSDKCLTQTASYGCPGQDVAASDVDAITTSHSPDPASGVRFAANGFGGRQLWLACVNDPPCHPRSVGVGQILEAARGRLNASDRLDRLDRLDFDDGKGNATLWLFLNLLVGLRDCQGFSISLAFESCKTPRRIALFVLHVVVARSRCVCTAIS